MVPGMPMVPGMNLNLGINPGMYPVNPAVYTGVNPAMYAGVNPAMYAGMAPGIYSGGNSTANSTMHSGTSYVNGIVWKWESHDGTKKPYDPVTSQHIENCRAAGKDCSFINPTARGSRKFRLDFHAMKQVNIDTGYHRNIYRESQ